MPRVIIGPRLLARGAFFVGLRIPVTFFLNIATLAIVLSSLGEVSWGVVTALQAALFIAVILETALATLVQRDLSIRLADSDTQGLMSSLGGGIRLATLLGGVVVILAVVVREGVAGGVGIPAGDLHSGAFAFSLLAASRTVAILAVIPRSLLEAMQLQGRLQITNVLEAVLRFALVATFLRGRDPTMVSFAYIELAIQMGLVAALFFVMPFKLEELGQAIRHGQIARLVALRGRYVGSLLIQQGGWQLIHAGTVLVINAAAGPVANGAWATAQRLVGYIRGLVASGTTFLQPAVTVLAAQGEQGRAQRLSIWICKWSGVGVASIALPVAFHAPAVLRALGASDGQLAAQFLAVLAITLIIRAAGSGLLFQVNAAGKIGAWTACDLIHGGLYLLVLWSGARSAFDHRSLLALVILEAIVLAARLKISGRIVGQASTLWLRGSALPVVCSAILSYLLTWGLDSSMLFDGVATLHVVCAIVMSSLVNLALLSDPTERVAFTQIVRALGSGLQVGVRNRSRR